MEIIKNPNPILHKKLENVRPEDQIDQLIKDMKKTMIEFRGVGLAANQVNKDLALFVIDESLAKENNAPDVYLNPEIEPYSKQEDIMEEGCLSIPGTWLKIKRTKKVKVKALNEKGDKIKFIAKGMLARVLQHEFDHLQGTLIIENQKQS